MLRTMRHVDSPCNESRPPARTTEAGPLGGTVTFKDGPTVLGTAAVVNGTATLSLGPTALAAGAHALPAEYSGDVLRGGSGRDWFFANRAGTGARDTVADLLAGDLVDELS